MKFDPSFTYGNVIAHVIPGSLVACYLVLQCDWLRVVLGRLAASAVGQVFAGATAILFVGLVIDGLRSTLVDRVAMALTRTSRPEDLFSDLGGDKLGVLQYIMESYWRHYQFYANCSVGCLIIAALSIATRGGCRGLLPAGIAYDAGPFFLLLGVAMFLMAAAALKRTIRNLMEFKS